MKLKSLQSVNGLTRAEVVPYYVNLLIMTDSRQEWTDEQVRAEVKRVNHLILSKWSPSGLAYIKDRAWKAVQAIKSLEQLKQAVLKG